MDAERIGKNISEHRKRNQLTQEQLAEKLGVSNRSVSRWENGKTMPDLTILFQVCRELHVSIGELVEGGWEIPDDDTEKNVQVILTLADRDRERKAKMLNELFIMGAVLFCIIILHDLFLLSGFLDAPVLDLPKTCFLFMMGLGFEAVGFYQNIKDSRKKTFTETEVAAVFTDEKELKMRGADEMLQVARKYQKAELKQYRKAFQVIAESLEPDEYAVFSMVADSYSDNESPGPWHVALAVTNRRLLLCGETVRGMLFTRQVMDTFDRDEVRSVELIRRKIVIKTTKDVIKMEGEGFEAVIHRLKRNF